MCWQPVPLFYACPCACICMSDKIWQFKTPSVSYSMWMPSMLVCPPGGSITQPLQHHTYVSHVSEQKQSYGWPSNTSLSSLPLPKFKCWLRAAEAPRGHSPHTQHELPHHTTTSSAETSIHTSPQAVARQQTADHATNQTASAVHPGARRERHVH